MRFALLFTISLSLPHAAGAQSDSTPAHATRADTLFARAQVLVREGNGAAGRVLVDSILVSSQEGTPRYAEALYWRATLAESASTAARDYLRLIVEYSLSPRVADALLRLGQLELARGNRDAAVRHLDRLVREHPDTPLLARANYWRARALLEGSDAASIARGCGAIAQAKAGAPASDIEFRNQVDYYSQRCSGVDTTVAPDSLSRADSARAMGKRDGRMTRTPGAGSTRDTSAKKPRARDVATSAPASRSSSTGKYSIQVAALKTESDATAIATKLGKRGFETRIVEGQGFYRVWVGNYQTRANAAEAVRELKARKIDGFIVESK